MKIADCNWTQLPNDFIDQGGIALVGPAATCLYWCIARKTKGWQKEGDAISYPQLSRLTGFARTTLSKALDKLLQHGLILAEKRGGRTTFYSLELSTTSPENGRVPVQKMDGSPNPNLILISDPLLRKDKDAGAAPSPKAKLGGGSCGDHKGLPNEEGASSKAYSQVFEDVWLTYPRKVNKQGAWKAFRTRAREGESAAFLATCVAEYAKRIKGTEERFIMHGATFFGPEKRYLDYKPEARAAKPAKIASVPRRPPEPLTAAERQENLRRLQEIGAKLAKKRGEMREVAG